jgi:hypothetical protein
MVKNNYFRELEMSQRPEFKNLSTTKAGKKHLGLLNSSIDIQQIERHLFKKKKKTSQPWGVTMVV